MLLKDIFTDPFTKIFSLQEAAEDDDLNAFIEPTAYNLLPECEGCFYVKAIRVGTSEETCYILISTPERIADYVLLRKGGQLFIEPYHTLDDVIPAVAAECYGNYKLYFNSVDPKPGIRVLIEGLMIAKNKTNVLEDLAHILNEVGRYTEKAEDFLLALQPGQDPGEACDEVLKLAKIQTKTGRKGNIIERYTQAILNNEAELKNGSVARANREVHKITRYMNEIKQDWSQLRPLLDHESTAVRLMAAHHLITEKQYVNECIKVLEEVSSLGGIISIGAEMTLKRHFESLG